MNFIFSVNNLEVRLAQNEDEIRQAQKLRYNVFYNEKGAKPNIKALETQLDIDDYDDICDHLLVIDHNLPKNEQVVGNYRLLMGYYLKDNMPFYTASEFNIEQILKKANAENLKLMELGRSCVHPAYRNNNSIQLLWRGITAYMVQKEADVLFGCASFSGTSLKDYAKDLSYLHHHHKTPSEWYVKALPEFSQNMNQISKEQLQNPKDIMQELPTLIKSYLRLGAFIGEGAVIDWQFKTIDVCIMLPTINIPKKYYSYFGR